MEVSPFSERAQQAGKLFGLAFARVADLSSQGSTILKL